MLIHVSTFSSLWNQLFSLNKSDEIADHGGSRLVTARTAPSKTGYHIGLYRWWASKM